MRGERMNKEDEETFKQLSDELRRQLKSYVSKQTLDSYFGNMKDQDKEEIIKNFNKMTGRESI
jgi:RecG-like helicase